MQSFCVSVMSAMSVIKKSNNSEGQIGKYCKILSVRKQGESVYTQVVAFHFINVFVFSPKKLGVILVISVLHNMKVKYKLV